MFDAFSTPAPDSAQRQKSLKDSIMSMYASSPSASKPPSMAPQESGFGDFSAFQQGSSSKSNDTATVSQAVSEPATQAFDPFKSHAGKNDGIPFDTFSSLNLMNNQVSATSAAGPPASLIGINSNVVNLLDDFETLKSSDPSVSTEPLSNTGKIILKHMPAVNDFTDFVSAPVTSPSKSVQSWSNATSHSNNTGESFSSVPLPDHSRTSTGFADLQISKGTPVDFSNLPPIEDGWSSFQ